MKLTISKFELYPNDAPTGYAVGFTVTTNNDRIFYSDTIVSLESAQNHTEEEIITLAYENLKDVIESQAASLETKVKVVGSEWTPTGELVAPITPDPAPLPEPIVPINVPEE